MTSLRSGLAPPTRAFHNMSRWYLLRREQVASHYRNARGNFNNSGVGLGALHKVRIETADGWLAG